MGATTGMEPIGAYDSGVAADNINELLALIPDPDAPHGTGAVADAANQGVNNTYLDEMSPGAAAQLRVELTALLDGQGNDSASGSHVVTAGEGTAHTLSIVTGLANITLANGSVTIFRAGTNVTADAAISESPAGTIVVADGAATYDVTAGDVVNWFARP